MGKRHGIACFLEDVQQAREGEIAHRVGVVLAKGNENVGQRAPLHVFHRVVDAPFGIETQFVNRNDVRMFELRRNLRLFHKPQLFFLRKNHIMGKNLDRHGTPAIEIARLVHHTHAAAREHAPEFILAATPGGKDVGIRRSDGAHEVNPVAHALRLKILRDGLAGRVIEGLGRGMEKPIKIGIGHIR